LEGEDGHARMMDFMNAADINIDGIEVQKKSFAPDMLPPDMPDPIREVLLRDLKNKKMANVRIRHLGESGDSVEFGLGDESDGTQKLFWIAGPWMDVLEKGRVLVIDELDTHLHPVLVHFLVGLMHGSGTNPQNAQLLFTTHNTSLLDDDSIRRDQFWFVEKKADNSTSVYPLTDFHPRKKEALERGYLKGRYGALPIIRKGMGHGA
jgi:AAA15 family ATPase/GTPase